MTYKLSLAAVLALTVVLGDLLCHPLLAEELPDAGQTLRGLEHIPVTQPSARETPSLQAPPEQVPLKKSSPVAPRLYVNAFLITGATSFSATELAMLVRDWRGKNLTLNDLQAAAAHITHFYRKKGFLVARAYIPAQTLSNNVVEIAIMEGQLGELQVNGNVRMSKERIKGFLKDLQSNEPLRQQAIEHELLSLNELAGVKHISAALKPGKSTGLSDLVVALEPTSWISGSVDIDNHGSRFTGQKRLGATLFVNSPLYLGDQLSTRLVTSDNDLHYGKVTYRIPVSHNGLSAGVAYSVNTYRLGEEFAVLDAYGNSQVTSLLAHYPLSLSRTDKISIEGSLNHKSLTDKVNVLNSAEDKSLYTATLGLVGTKEGPGFIANFSLNYTNGRLDIETPALRALDGVSAQAQGGFSTWTLAASGILAILDRWELHSTLNGQLAQNNLDSSEKLVLGGIQGVRAYPQSDISSDEGYIVSTEMRYRIPTRQLGTVQMGIFTDYGWARINHSPYLAGENTHELLSAGLSLHWNAPFAVLLRGFFAWELDNESLLSEDQRSPRSWIQLQKHF